MQSAGLTVARDLGAESIEARTGLGTGPTSTRNPTGLQAHRGHLFWLALIELYRELGHGDIDRLSIQDGLPVLAETMKKKVRFTR